MPVAHRTQAAENDLCDFAYQIGVESGRPQAADQVIDELIDCIESLANLSTEAQLGTSAAELGRGVRMYSHRRWVVVFRYVDDGILVLRIADGRQDYFSWKFG